MCLLSARLVDALVYLEGLGQDVGLFLGLVAEVVTDPAELYTFGPNRVHCVMVALDELLTMQRVELGFLYCGLEREKKRSEFKKIVQTKCVCVCFH